MASQAPLCFGNSKQPEACFQNAFVVVGGAWLVEAGKQGRHDGHYSDQDHSHKHECMPFFPGQIPGPTPEAIAVVARRPKRLRS